MNGEDEDDEDDDEDDPQQCSKRQNRELHDELTGLHLRKTEVIKDCVKKNLEHAVINGTEESVSRFEFREVFNSYHTQYCY